MGYIWTYSGSMFQRKKLATVLKWIPMCLSMCKGRQQGSEPGAVRKEAGERTTDKVGAQALALLKDKQKRK